MRRVLQSVIAFAVRPYTVRELPGWGRILNLVADYKKDWLWRGAPTKVIIGKIHSYKMHLALDQWADRSTYFIGRWYDLETQLFLRDQVGAGDTVVDIGANRGMFALSASSIVGERGKIICFEPNPRCVDALRLEIEANRINNIQVHQTAIGDKAGELVLAVPYINSGQATLANGLYRQDECYRVNVPVVVGDDALSGESPRVIKIDVEGFEHKVLCGLVETIKRCRPIIIQEVNERFLNAAGNSFSDTIKFMNGLGYHGKKLTLGKKHGKYNWDFAELPTAGDFDAVWIYG